MNSRPPADAPTPTISGRASGPGAATALAATGRAFAFARVTGDFALAAAGLFAVLKHGTSGVLRRIVLTMKAAP
jgi:hypothetical protein